MCAAMVWVGGGGQGQRARMHTNVPEHVPRSPFVKIPSHPASPTDLTKVEASTTYTLVAAARMM